MTSHYYMCCYTEVNLSTKFVQNKTAFPHFLFLFLYFFYFSEQRNVFLYFFSFLLLYFIISANILFAISVLTMVVVSFFTKRIPRDELGGLTWPTINEPPLSHGAIGEHVEHPEKQGKPGSMQMQGKIKTGLV